MEIPLFPSRVLPYGRMSNVGHGEIVGSLKNGIIIQYYTNLYNLVMEEFKIVTFITKLNSDAQKIII